MEYIEKLEEYLPKVRKWLNEDLANSDFSRWDTLIINRRKPYTYRAFTMDGDYRICLHRFDGCSEEEAFKHPHPWPAAFKVVKGSYRHWVGRSPDLTSQPLEVFDSVMTAGAMYEISDRHTWHGVQPYGTVYTIMVNGPAWKDPHIFTVTTKGKDLDKMSEDELRNHLQVFNQSAFSKQTRRIR